MSVINTFGYYSQNKELSLTQNVEKPREERDVRSCVAQRGGAVSLND